ncbi:hypothetical protein LFM09_44800 [Lentzea alba]|uniref:hypothetical protein n=1 Tax=Lentzea alba TaxID=2714351 RepID=UPI0039BFD954
MSALEKSPLCLANEAVICWDRCDDELIGIFDNYEISVLRSHGEALLALLDHRERSYENMPLDDNRTALLPNATTDDTRLIAILRDQLGQDEPDWLLTLHEVASFDELRVALGTFLATLPSDSGAVRLRSRVEAEAWARSIQVFAAALAAVTDETGRAFEQDAGPTSAWLARISGGLSEALDGGSSPDATHVYDTER